MGTRIVEKNMKQKKLSLSDRTFREIIKRNVLYVDKTEYIFRMLNVDDFNCCFLSRPRRFGKTLLLSTIQELFQGNREFFNGLWIDQSDYDFEKHPVLKFTMSYAKLKTPDDLADRLEFKLMEMAEDNGIRLTADSYDEMLGQLLKRMYGKHGVPAVILVDEYDSPVTTHMSNRELAKSNRDILHGFYQAMKTNIEYIRFALVTGITRFAMTSLDSGPNNFRDISLNPEYAGICGITPDELDTYFKDRFPDTLEKLKDRGSIHRDADYKELTAKILEWYDGYNWLGSENILNPYSIFTFFFLNEFDTYWPLSGKPSHLTVLARENPLDYIQPNLDGYTSYEIRKSALSSIKAVPILFHCGYLTIKNQIPAGKVLSTDITDVRTFSFRTPNKEVELDFKASLFQDAFDPDDIFFSEFSKKFPTALLDTNTVDTVNLLQDLLSAIAYEQHDPSEKHYHAVLQAAFIATGLEVLGQTHSSRGKSDMSVIIKNRVRVVIEVKYCKIESNDSKVDKTREEKELSAALDEAAAQIKGKDYAAPFRAAGCKVICLALAVRGRDKVAARFVEY
ncbi:MAG: AAA family ATPase [Deltaproteobacteria bacterium]|jgi:hypothetical protein|nr:AAA family ATPase [Deltaproteobacteria bacterium]